MRWGSLQSANKMFSRSNTPSFIRRCLLTRQPVYSHQRFFFSTNAKDKKEEGRVEHVLDGSSKEALSKLSGVPVDLLNRVADIYKPPPSTTQSGTKNVQKWLLKFSRSERWSNPLMGWTSSSDPVQNLTLKFPDKESAVRFCQHHGYNYRIFEDHSVHEIPPKSYSDNFKYKPVDEKPWDK